MSQKLFRFQSFHFVIVVFVLIFLGMGGLVWMVYDANRVITRLIDRDTRIVNLRGEVVRLDEILTLLSRVAVKTGDLKYVERYDELFAELDKALVEAMNLAPPSVRDEVNVKTNAANLALLEMEKRALDMVRQGLAPEGEAIVFGPEYDRQKGIYAEGMVSLNDYLKESAAQAERDRERSQRLTTVVVAGMVALVFGLGYLFYYQMRMRRQLESSYRELTALFEQLKMAKVEIEQKSGENERLLLNILPAPIVQRLRQGEERIADAFAEVTVLFADMVGFTSMAGKMSAAELVKMLNELFSRFDTLGASVGVEKIKTIGDAYMAACGLPSERPDHPQVMMEMAIGMMEAINDYNGQHGTNLQVRIGLNTGPVVAGVIGKHKFIYDLWGDAVNVASRMESSGLPGRVHMTESTARKLDEAYSFEFRGEMEIKGKGKMGTYLYTGRKSQGLE